MGVRRVAALAVAGWLAVVSVACGPVRQPAPAPSGGSDVAREALAEAYRRSVAVSHTVETGSGTFASRTVVDPASDRGTLSVQQVHTGGTAVSAEARRIAGDTWIRAAGVDGIDPDTWIHVASERTVGTMVAIDADDTVEALLRALVEVRGAAPLYSGTLMLLGAVNAHLGLGGTTATVTRFTATVDERGRLTSLTIDANAMVGLSATTTTLSGFEAPVRVTAPPAADVVEGTDEMLSAFGIN